MDSALSPQISTSAILSAAISTIPAAQPRIHLDAFAAVTRLAASTALNAPIPGG